MNRKATLRLLFEDRPGYLLAHVSGPHSLDEGRAVFRQIAAAARERNARRILLDSTGITGHVPDLDRYDLAKEAAAMLHQVERLAMVVGAFPQYTGFGIDVARNRGLDVRPFRDPDEAIAWLHTTTT
jgi:hypothetical protein